MRHRTKIAHRLKLCSGLLLLLLILGVGPAWADIVATENVYLGAVVEFNPQLAGSARNGTYEVGMIGSDHMPILNGYALGAPTGTGSWLSATAHDGLMLGIGGSAVFAFEEGYYIYNGDGDDFRTWGDRFCWGGVVNEHVSELAHVQVSEDGINWYYNSAEAYDINPDPSTGNGDYNYYNVSGLHGNTPNWANYTQDMQAQEDVNGVWTDIDGVVVPADFDAATPYVGGDAFDLDTFRSLVDDSLWPEDGQMRYLKLIDDDSILDGQSYAPAWKTGAIMQAAMGINAMEITAVPLPGALWLFCTPLAGLLGRSGWRCRSRFNRKRCGEERTSSINLNQRTERR